MSPRTGVYMKDKSRVLVIGLDGATWNLIKPLVEEGKLPTIAKLMSDGCYGDLKSSIPRDTFPAWKCYSTGKNPGKLGAYWYLGVDIPKEKFVLHNSTSFKSKELWDYLGEKDMNCGVLDMPTTYPCRPINGVMIAHGAPRPVGYTSPEYLEKELKDIFDYSIDPILFELGKEAGVASTEEIIRQRFDVAHYLLQKFDLSFLHLTVYYVDSVQHLFWKEMEGNDPRHGKVIEDVWILIDSGIGRLLDEFGDAGTHVILMSDHGFTAARGEFQVSEWLVGKGLLQLRKASPLARLGLNNFKVLSTVARSRLLVSILRLLMPRGIRSRILGLLPRWDPASSPAPRADSIDWRKSKVIPISEGLYINRDLLDSLGEYEDLRDTLIREIKEIEEPRTGEKLAREVYRREEIYSGEYVDDAPDLAILPNDGYATFTCSRQGWTGVHKLQGIFLACGPEIKKGVEIQGAEIYDVAPTILHICGVPIPGDMDGKVLREIFEQDSVLATREIEYREVDEGARVKDRIRELKSHGRI